MRAFRYAFEEAVSSLWRDRRSGLIATGTIAIALFVLGGFLWLAATLDELSARWRQAAELSVYLHESATSDDKAAIERSLLPGGVVAAVEFVSQEEARRRFKQMFSELGSAIDSFEANPLPASYEVRLAPTSKRPAVDALAGALRGMSGVSDVRYDRQWLDRLLSAVNAVQIVGMVLGTVLTVAAALTVANVVRLTLYARRDELEIMRLVGAPLTYIRGPFVMEGVLQGGIGAGTALLALALTFFISRARLLAPLATALDLNTVPFLSVGACVLLVIGGMAVGCLGGVVAGGRQT